MEKKYKISSLNYFERLKAKHKYFEAVPKDILEKFLGYQGYAIIKEYEDPATLITTLNLLPCNDSKKILCRIEVIKENLNKYAKEGIENPDGCAIERIRNDLLNISKYFGDNWHKEYRFLTDKYLAIRSLLHHITNCLNYWDTKNFDTKIILYGTIYLLADKVSKHEVCLGKRFAEKLQKILVQEELAGMENRILSRIISTLGISFNKVIIDFEFINKQIEYNHLTINTEGNYWFNRLDCNKLSFEKGCLELKNSTIDNINISDDSKKVYIKNVLTGTYPKISKVLEQKIRISNLVTYEDLRKKKAIVIRDKG